MKHARLFAFTIAALLAFTFIAATPALAGKPKKQPQDEPTPLIVRKIVGVDAAKKMIDVQSAKKSTAYKIDDFTKVKVGNMDGKFEDLKVGMVVKDLIERDFDTLDSIQVDMDFTSAATEKAPAKGKKKK